METSTSHPTPEQIAEQVGKLLAAGGTLGSVYDFTDRDYEVLYALGYSLYDQGRYADAMKAFGFLVLHNHLERRFLSALASSLQMLRRYDEAIHFHTLASVMDLTDPRPTFHTCECMIAQGKGELAREGLQMVIAQCGASESHAPLRARAEGLLALMAPAAASPGRPS